MATQRRMVRCGDYIHVVDLAEGHVTVIKHGKAGVHVYNLGTGKGTSVLELIHTFERVNGIKVPYKIVERRAGDMDAGKASSGILWTSRYGLVEMCKDA